MYVYLYNECPNSLKPHLTHKKMYLSNTFQSAIFVLSLETSCSILHLEINLTGESEDIYIHKHVGIVTRSLICKHLQIQADMSGLYSQEKYDISNPRCS